MKSPGLLLTSVALNLILAGVLVVVRGNRSAPAALDITAIRPVPTPAVRDSDATETNLPAAVAVPMKFHWGLVESADYRQYIANLRALDCPERLIRDIIIADIGKLYTGRLEELGSGRDDWQPWHGRDRRHAGGREHSARRSTLQAEQRALLKELLGIEWNEEWNDLLHDESIAAIALGFLPDPKPIQFIALIEGYRASTRAVNEKVNNILLKEDREELARLRAGVLMKFNTLMSSAEFDELSRRAQSLGKFLEGDIHLEGVTLSGAEFRELCGLSRLTGDVILDYLLNDDAPELSEAEEERRQQAFEAEVKKLLGPARFADFQRAQQAEFQDAFEFTQEHQLPVSVAARISDALRHAEEQASQITANESLSGEEQAAALTLLKSVTVNALSAALGSKYAEYARTKGKSLDELLEVPSPPEGRP